MTVVPKFSFAGFNSRKSRRKSDKVFFKANFTLFKSFVTITQKIMVWYRPKSFHKANIA